MAAGKVTQHLGTFLEGLQGGTAPGCNTKGMEGDFAFVFWLKARFSP